MTLTYWIDTDHEFEFTFVRYDLDEYLSGYYPSRAVISDGSYWRGKHNSANKWTLYPTALQESDYTYYSIEQEDWIYPFDSVEDMQRYVDGLLVKAGYELMSKETWQKVQLLK